MFSKSSAKIVGLTLVIVFAAGAVAYASHSWGGYHWARTANPFTLKLGDNVSTAWDAYLAEASSDWSQSSVLDTTVVAGSKDPKKCGATTGRVEVCSAKYGFRGWLGVASIWVSGNHITKGTAKMNDSYFGTATYNTPAWRRLVMCQEVAHTFGLDHQDENFNNANLGSCMDYTNDPDGPLSNEHPNAHDFAQLELIYAHLDGSTTVGAAAPSGPGKSGLANVDVAESSEWGKVLRNDGKGRPSLYVRDLGRGEKVFTFVFWAE
ncbi:MAG: hypothetical protein Q7R94_00445 [bacterium]|nr:hypothetical protein [bacterium]